jgi:phage-related protein
MGTDMQSIVETYQSLSRGNYQMLDNLKLGYGGTKTEMERMIADANKVKEANGEMANLSIDSFADVTEAIHIIQNEMGITGTTAKEASSTISGSVGMVQASWGNLLTGVADDTADFDQLINNFVDSVGLAAQNLIPRIATALSGIVQLVQKLLPQIPPLIQQFLPVVVEGIMQVTAGVVEMLPSIVDTIMQVLPMLITALIEMLPTLTASLSDILVQVINALTEMLPTIIDAIIEVVPLLINALIAAIPQLLQASITFLMAIVQALPTIIQRLIAELPKIIDTTVNFLIKNVNLIVQGAIQLFMGIIKAIPQILTALAQNLPQIIRSIVNGLIEGIPQLIQAGKDLLSGLFTGLLDPQKIWQSVKSLFNSIIGGLKSLFGIHSPSTVMADVIGKNLALGIGEGFDENIDGVNKRIAKAINVESPSINVNGTASGAGRTVVINQTNNYSQAHSRYEIYKSKQQTAAAVRLALAGV